MNLLILVVDDEPDVEALFRQHFRRDLRAAPATPVGNARYILRPEADPLKSVSRVHNATRRHVIFGGEEVVEFIAVGEIYRERRHYPVGRNPKRPTIGPVVGLPP